MKKRVKNLLIIASVCMISGIAILSASVNSQSNTLLEANLAALTKCEHYPDESSGSWSVECETENKHKCSPGGSEACPMPW